MKHVTKKHMKHETETRRDLTRPVARRIFDTGFEILVNTYVFLKKKN